MLRGRRRDEGMHVDRLPTQERTAAAASGFVYVALGIVLGLVAVGVLLARPAQALMLLVVPLLFIGEFWCLGGLYMLQPNQAALLTLFGSYRGTDRTPGLRWANPFYAKHKLSVRAHNFNSEKLKVNDLRGNPIEIAAAIVWRVHDTARARFDVEDFEGYVLTQAEAAVRHLASGYAYDNLDEPAGEPLDRRPHRGVDAQQERLLVRARHARLRRSPTAAERAASCTACRRSPPAWHRDPSTAPRAGCSPSRPCARRRG